MKNKMNHTIVRNDFSKQSTLRSDHKLWFQTNFSTGIKYEEKNAHYISTTDYSFKIVNRLDTTRP